MLAVLTRMRDRSSPYYNKNNMVYNTLSWAKDIKVTAIDETDPYNPKALCQVTFKPSKKKPLTDGAIFFRLTRVNRENKWMVRKLSIKGLIKLVADEFKP